MRMDRTTVLLDNLDTFFPRTKGPGKHSMDVDYHLLSVLLILCTRGDVMEKVFPLQGAFDPSALYDLGVDKERVPPSAIERLRAYRSHFAIVQLAWLNFAE